MKRSARSVKRSAMTCALSASGKTLGQSLNSELAAERRRYHAALTQLQQRLLAFTQTNIIHEHLTLPSEHYQQQVRDRLFPDLELRAAQKLAASGQR